MLENQDENLQRGDILFEQGRWGGALEAYEVYLAEHPDDSHALCMAARCFLRLELYGKASEYAGTAIGLTPDYAYAYYIQAFVYFSRNLPEDARSAMNTALELEPTNPSFWVLSARLLIEKVDWKGAQEAADTALGFDPQHADALIVKAGVLVRQGLYNEAITALDSVLADDPENEQALTELGFLYLHQSRWDEALKTFQSALALDPESEGARAGLMNAMRAKFPVYGLVLRYFFWMNRFSKKYQQILVYGMSFLARALGGLQKEYPAWAPLIGLVLLVFRIFTYLTWTIRAGTTLLLRFNKVGRSLVSDEEVLESNLVGGMWLAALLCWLYHMFVDPFTMFCRIGMPIFLTLPLVAGGAFGTASDGWPRYVSRGIFAVMALCSIGGLALYVMGVPLGITLLIFYFNSFTWVLLILSYLEGLELEKE